MNSPDQQGNQKAGAVSHAGKLWREGIDAIGRAGSAVARWSGSQSWFRLFLFAILLLIAQGIIGDILFGFRSESHHAKQKQQEVHVGAPGIDIRDDDSGDHVHIGLDGISVSDGSKTKEKDKAKTTEGKGQTPEGKSQAPESKASDSGKSSEGADDDGKAPAPVASGDAGNSKEDDHNDLTIEIDAHSGVGAFLQKLLENCVMLLIVYAIGAKLLWRQTEQTEARASQAEALAEREALERQLAQAKLQALQAQVEPHFLFNTLASVDYLIESDPQRASKMQKHLIQYLRSALPQMRSSQSNLGREIDLSRAYLEILKMRMEDRLILAFDIPDGLRSAEFPPMILQSLVENAITHGLEPSAAGGELKISARIQDGDLVVEVADTGVGLHATAAPSSGGGVGLSNIRERIQRLYPQRAGFTLVDNQPSGARAVLNIPYKSVTQ